jgi:Zn-dependent metalloprotease
LKLSARIGIALALAAVVAASSVPTHGQQGVHPTTTVVNASGLDAAQWAARVDTMLHDGVLDIAAVQADTMIPGRVHQRLDQRYEGLPVFGGQLIRQMAGNAVVSVAGRMFENVALPTVKPAIDADKAREIAERNLGPGASADAPTLGVLAKSDAYVLVYRMVVKGSLDIRRYDVNAITGAVEGSLTEIRRQNAIGKGKGVLGDDKKVVTQKTTSGYQTVDAMRPAFDFTYALDGSLGRFLAFANTLQLFDSDLGFSGDNNWNDSALVDAHAYAGWTYDFYYKMFGRRGINDQNATLTIITHGLGRGQAVPPSFIGQFVNNAFYFHPGLLYFGDGDGFNFDYFAGGLDVVAHEISHGVTAFSSNLEYHDEPGALNEAFSDVMGISAEFFHLKPGQGPQRGPNFLMGEDVTKCCGGFIRSAQNPASVGDPDHYSVRYRGSADEGGVHINSTIITHAFYLAIAGGTNRVSGINVTGIGVANIERMERIFYRGFVFGLVPISQFRDARVATLQAATDLYGAGSNERAQLERAWTAVGVN